jgi:porin
LLRERLGLGLEHEDALEFYYNLAITGWLSATADFQYVNQALNKALNPNGPGFMNVDHAAIAGLRLRVRF